MRFRRVRRFGRRANGRGSRSRAHRPDQSKFHATGGVRALPRMKPVIAAATIALCGAGWSEARAITVPVSLEYAGAVAQFQPFTPQLVKKDEPQFDNGTGIDLRESVVGRLPRLDAGHYSTDIASTSASGKVEERVVVPGADGYGLDASSRSGRLANASARRIVSPGGQSGANGRDVLLRDVVGALINVERKALQETMATPVSAGGFDDEERKTGVGDDTSMLDDILNLPVGGELAERLEAVVTPRLAADGIVSFSVAGMGNFAIVLSEQAGALSVVNVAEGGSITFAVNNDDNAAGPRVIGVRRLSDDTEEEKITLEKFLAALEKFFFSVVKNHLFIGGLFLFSTLGFFWRTHRRRR